ncbi:MAG: serine/threonine-protein kinase [Polyangiaceae bacterium]
MLKPGETLDGKYRITRQIGEGGMGAVYAAENTRVRKTVAVKVLHKGGGGVADAVARFEREAQAAGQIGSDHIVEVYDLGTTPDGERFMVMEYLDGESLRDRFKKGSVVPPSAIVPLVLQLLDGLAAAHAAEIVHRDLKPDNIFILKEKAGRPDFVKILDFGISKFLNVAEGDGAVTRTGMVMGSPNYMSPEQVKSSNDVDARSDLYTVGVILYEAVTGHVPFKAPTFTELLFKIVYEPLPHPCSINPSLDPAFADILLRACAQSRSDRFQTARDFSAALLAYLGYAPSPGTSAGVPSVKQTALGVGNPLARSGATPAAAPSAPRLPPAPCAPPTEFSATSPAERAESARRGAERSQGS